ncbi:MAG: methylenetetrahydrofolate reductase (NADPH) [Candidatus Poriferisodalaceae bacterium]|jgi:methylenetetrahydrofolate reductase (NADPH)
MALFGRIDHKTAAPLRKRLLSKARFEIIPLKNLSAQLEYIPAGSSLSVTASPVKAIEDTLDLTEKVLGLGHRPVPHIGARMVESKEHLARLLDRIGDMGITELFLVGGDAPEPFGDFDHAVQVLEAIAALDHSLTHIGVTAYPDGHGFISDEKLHKALFDKQEILQAMDIKGHASTQMCFDADAIRTWLATERAAGLELPIHLGIPGAVDRAKLITMGARLGVGASLRYLKKNSGTLTRMFAPGGYDPNKLLGPLAGELDALGIEGLHIFTFNQIEATVEWRDAAIGQLD